MNCLLMGVIVLVSLACAGLCSADSSKSDGKPAEPLRVLRDVSEVPIRYKPEQLFDLLGYSLKQPNWEKVIDILAATSDKDKPNTIANKYSINDLLAMNEVYEKDFTRDKFREKIALCESLTPESLEKPKQSLVKFLINMDTYTKDGRTLLESEARKPLEFLFYKNLYDFCKAALDNYHFLLWANLRVHDDELDKKAVLFRVKVDNFRKKYRSTYKDKDPRNPLHAKEMVTAFMTGKPEEVAPTKEMCSELIAEVGFVAERKLHGHKWNPLNYDLAFSYCKALLGQE